MTGYEKYQPLIMTGYTKGKPHEDETLRGHKSTLKIHLYRYQKTSEIFKHSLEASRVEGGEILKFEGDTESILISILE